MTLHSVSRSSSATTTDYQLAPTILNWDDDDNNAATNPAIAADTNRVSNRDLHTTASSTVNAVLSSAALLTPVTPKRQYPLFALTKTPLRSLNGTPPVQPTTAFATASVSPTNPSNGGALNGSNRSKLLSRLTTYNGIPIPSPTVRPTTPGSALTHSAIAQRTMRMQLVSPILPPSASATYNTPKRSLSTVPPTASAATAAHSAVKSLLSPSPSRMKRILAHDDDNDATAASSLIGGASVSPQTTPFRFATVPPNSPKKQRLIPKPATNTAVSPTMSATVPSNDADAWFFPSTPKKPIPASSSSSSAAQPTTPLKATALTTPPLSPPISAVKSGAAGVTHVAGQIHQATLGNRIFPVRLIGEGNTHQVFVVEADGTVVEDGQTYQLRRIALKAEKENITDISRIETYSEAATKRLNNPALGFAQLTAIKFPVGPVYRHPSKATNTLGIVELMKRTAASSDGCTFDAWAKGERYEQLTGLDKKLLDIMIHWLTLAAQTYCPLEDLSDAVTHRDARRKHFEKLPFFHQLKALPGFDPNYENFEGLELCNDLYPRNWGLDYADNWKFIDPSPLQHEDFYLHHFGYTCAVANGSTNGRGFNHAKFNQNIWDRATANYPAALRARLEKSLAEKRSEKAVDQTCYIPLDIRAFVLAEEAAAKAKANK